MKDTNYIPNIRRPRGMETIKGFFVNELSERVWQDFDEETGKAIGNLTVVSLDNYRDESPNGKDSVEVINTAYFSP